MPSDKIIAEFEKLLRAKRGVPFKPNDRLGLEKPLLSQESDNTPPAAWEKAAALLGAALSPGSTIASMVLAPPAEETIFERQVTGPDGKQTILPPTRESVVPKMRKQQRAAIKPNPIVAAIQRHFQKGPTADPANDLLHQKINDRDFLVHATRPEAARKIRKEGGILPGAASELLPESVLNHPVIKKILTEGDWEVYKSPFSSKKILENTKTKGGYKLIPNMAVGEPGVEPPYSPGVSFSRQMSVPSLSEKKNYRLLLDPKSERTFSTAEPGYGKAGSWQFGKPQGFDRYESEQRTYGTPYPVKPANRAITPDVPTLPTEERVATKNVNTYRATMGNETVKTLLERIGFKERPRSERIKEYETLKSKADSLWNKMMETSLSSNYEAIAKEWDEVFQAQQKAFDDLYK